MIKLSWVTCSGLKLLAGTKKLMGKVFALKKSTKHSNIIHCLVVQFM